MTQTLHQQANALLYQALEQPTELRHEFLVRACGDRRDLLDMVNTMLSHIDQLDAFLEAPLALAPGPAAATPDAVPQAGEAPGELPGHWRLVRELERGRLGAIMLVERDGVIAALKVVDDAALSLEELTLFHRQRQLLATLSDPDIARLLDGGNLPDGRPYFVVEYSDGVPVDEYCVEANLSVRERIELFIRICAAVHHAHQRLVAHRHLQPSNILVGRDGSLKVSEFGIANLLESAISDVYASPEQLAGRGATTASDIHALGGVLRTMLAGNRAVHGDLARILTIADQDDPAQRYPSADELARDLRRHLARRPIMAVPTPPLRKLGMLMRRRPAASAVSVLLLAALLACAAIGAHTLAESPAVRGQWNALLEGVSPSSNAATAPPAAKPGVVGAASVVGVAGAADAKASSLVQRRDAAAALYKAGAGGDLPGAIAAWAALEHDADAAGDKALRAEALEQLAWLRHIAGDSAGQRDASQTLSILAGEALEAHPELTDWRIHLAKAEAGRARVALEQGENAEALAALEKAMSLREQAGGPLAVREMAAMRAQLGDTLAGGGDYPAAETEYKQAHDTLAALDDDVATREAAAALDLARADAQYVRKHWKTAADTVRQVRAALGKDGNPAMLARADLLEALIQPGGTAAQAYATAQAAVPEIVKVTETDSHDALALRESAFVWRRAGEIGLRAKQKESACAYLAKAAQRYTDLERTQRLNALDKTQREQVATLRGACQ